MGVSGQGQSFNQGAVFNPESAYAGSLYSANFNAENDARIAAGNAKAAITGAAIGAVGSIGGGFAKKCWVAREVYGSWNPKWMLFREWMLNDSPGWFKRMYLKHGPKIAEFIHDKPLLRKLVRRFMDSKIGG